MNEKREADALPLTLDRRGHVIIPIRVTPRATQTRIDRITSDALIIRLAAPPVDGAANKALIEFLSRLLHCPRRHVHLLSGGRSRSKRVAVEGVSRDDVAARLLGAIYI